MTRSRAILFFAVLLAILASPLLTGEADARAGETTGYAELRDRAEALYADGAYARAGALYERAAALDLAEDDARWTAFRIADTAWRAAAGSSRTDETVFEAPRRALEAIVQSVVAPDDRDETWAAAQTSLGDFWWQRVSSRNWGRAWQHYQPALDWWAGSSELDVARRHYLDLVFAMTEPSWMDQLGWYGSVQVPLDVLENARRIAEDDPDRSRTHYLLAMGLRQWSGSWRQRRRVVEQFEAALALGPRTPWYDDALYRLGEWLMTNGRVHFDQNGNWRSEPDFVAARETFERLLREFRPAETRYHDDATQRIREITDPALGATVSNVFLPGSEIRFDLNWRNVPAVDLRLSRVDLTRAVAPATPATNVHQWVEHVKTTPDATVRSWTYDTADDGAHRPGRASITLDEPLETGAYLLVARAGDRTARQLVLVSDATVVLKAWDDTVLAYMCDAGTGAPIPGAAVRVWDYRYDRNRWTGDRHDATTDDDGVCTVALDARANTRRNRSGVLVTVAAGDRQAFATIWPGHRNGNELTWKVHASTDRPAYRPDETVHWKLVARTNDGSGYSTPSGETLEFVVNDPRGATVHEGTLALNEFGSAWGEMALDASMPLGLYNVVYWTKGRTRHIGNATLFRLEEYKLPEFEVSVRTPTEAGRAKAFRPGDEIEVTVDAQYYFGAAVANANVEVIVRQRPFWPHWSPPRDFPWCYEQPNFRRSWGGQGQVIRRETIRTGADGTATLAFETPASGGQALEFVIEARVTDASRREVAGSGRVRVAPQLYVVHATPRSKLYRPGADVDIDFTALDANGNPVATNGSVVVTREKWIEIWLDPDNREVRGDDLAALRARLPEFPPPAPRPGWRLKFRGYESEHVLERTLATDDAGTATIAFAAPRDGYYKVTWRSPDRIGPKPTGSAPTFPPVTATTTVWVADTGTTALGYHHAGVEIIVDKDTFRAGETARVMLSTDTPGSWVLFSVEGADLHDWQLVHVPQTVRLVEIPIARRHVPNVYLQALSVRDGQILGDQEQVVVPPVDEFLTIEITPDRDAYEPRETGTLTVVTRDADGAPVSAEVALALVDASVFAIQTDLAPDPRAFFHDDKQPLAVQTASTFDQLRYLKLVQLDDADGLVDGTWREENELRKTDLAGAPAEGLAMQDSAVRMRGDVSGRSAPAASMAPAREMAASDEDSGARGGAGGGDDGPAVVVRSDFRSTIFWRPDVVTGPDGRATVEVTYADSITRWNATARAVTTGSRVGIGTTETRTRRPLVARLQTPRFFTAGDSVVIAGVLNNNTDAPMLVRPALEATGLEVLGRVIAGRVAGDGAAPVTVPPHGSARVEWQAVAQTPGAALVRLVARGDDTADAMERTLVVHEHGIEKYVATSGRVRGDAVTIALDVPASRKRDSTVLQVAVTSSMAVTMLDALPYLVDYPYGCTEQTMSRFLPAVITARTLGDVGLSADDALGRVFGGIEPDHADQTHPGGAARRDNLKKLDVIAQAGLDRLADFQHGDGGWGWWKDGDSDPYMSAYVLWGLSLSREADLDVSPEMCASAASYLRRMLVEAERQHELQAWMLHALAAHHAASDAKRPSAPERAAIRNLTDGVDRLNAYGRALLALALHDYDDDAKARRVLRTLENGVQTDRAPDRSILLGAGGAANPAVIPTAHWGADRIGWRWSDGPVETTAFCLRALLAVDPDHELVEPAMNWLVKNRRGAQWSNTRDTAIAVLTLNDYLRASGEIDPRVTWELRVNGRPIATKTVTAAEVLLAPSVFAIDPADVRDGRNEIEIVRRDGAGPIYFAASATFFSLEEPVTSAGSELFVRRDYYRLVPRRTLLKGWVYERQRLADGDYVTSGDRIEVVLAVEAKNEYEYLVFEDLKPAGFEAVELRSGEAAYARELNGLAIERRYGPAAGFAAPPVRDPSALPSDEYTGRQRWVHQELRDRKVAVFVDTMPQGTWELRYDLRAETPGTFHALPVMGHAMYVPEVRCNGNELRLTVESED